MNQQKIKLIVKKSTVHGLGLFAQTDIPSGALLGHLTGKYVDGDHSHVLWVLNEQGDWQCFEVQCDFKYINHSAHPNVAYYNDLTVVALTDIQAGDELFHDYGDEFDPSADK